MTASDAHARLADLLDRHGADSARWPPPARAFADTLRDDAAAQAMLRDAAALDAWLDAVPPPAPALRNAILVAAASQPHGASAGGRPGFVATLRALWFDLGGARLAAPALAMALAAGVGLGLALEPSTFEVDDDADDLLALAQIDDRYTEFAP
ncbi:hypothetical protein [Chiayiivirga flava]|uniref:Uncharacterized protein n=1 Tax=Chiayiivirga flava TaxID=659595 RepID=A0A7W8G3A8_9GAMM|nr:hypothetical protein [Chiayiivirga flava]MBB5209615.1 hypothetical protein [Chiayiivirga flava]